MLDEHVPLVKHSAHLANEIYSTSDEYLVVDDATDAQASVQFHENATYVVFRGSESRTDWVMNIVFRFRFAPISPSNPDLRAHSGFVYQWEGVRAEIVHLLSKYHDPTKPLVLCGHSLGGAVATVAAVDLSDAAYRCVLVTFGSPRALNWHSKNAFFRRNVPAYRVTNGADVVTMVPILLLHHVGEQIECHAKPWWYLISVVDHSMATYAEWGRAL